MTETTLADLDKEIAKKQEQRRRLKLVEEQRTKLLPRLHDRMGRLSAQVEGINSERDRLSTAIAEIEGGKPTKYRLRAKPVRKAKKGAAEPPAEA